MIRNNVCSKYSLVCVGLLLLFSLSTYSASGQVSFPGLHSDPHFSFFGTFTNLKPDYQYYGDYAAVGFTSGAFLQTSHILGWEGRGSITRWQGLEHQETLLVGPRAAVHYGRISPLYMLSRGRGERVEMANPAARRAARAKTDRRIWAAMVHDRWT